MAKEKQIESQINPKLINSLLMQKKFSDAEKLLNHVLTKSKTNELVHYYLGRLYYETQKFDQAIEHLTIAHQRLPRYQNIHLMLFNIYSSKNDINNAIHSLQAALTINNQDEKLNLQYLHYLYLNKRYQKAIEYCKSVPATLIKNKQFCNLCGLLYREIGNFETAAQYFTKAIQLDPNYFEVFDNMAFIYLQTGQHKQAIKILNKCIQLCSQYVHPYIALTQNYLALNQLSAALDTINKAYQLSPDDKDILALYVQTARYACDWSKVKKLAPQLDKCIAHCITANTLVPERPWLNVTRVQDEKENYLVAKNSMDHYVFPRIANYHSNYKFNRTSNNKIKIGYFSNDFYNHPTMHLLGNMFKYHDRELFEIHLFSYGPIEPKDPYYQQAKHTADYFYDIPDEGFQNMADFIYQKNIDILVDLKGYTKGAKLEVMALKPAPILIQYLGYPGSMGSHKYDYTITDKIITPLKQAEYYAEKFIYMPHSYQITDNQQVIDDEIYTRQDFGLPEDMIILSTFNNSFKIEQASFSIWLNILQKHDNTILWIYEPNDFLKTQLLDFAKKYNGQQNRIYFAPKLKKAKHLARIKLVDLMLDTFTCNGHTTTTDALWSGVPVITLLGNHFASRVSASILNAMALPELVTESEKDYFDKISYYCEHLDALNLLKQKISANRSTAPLFKNKKFVEAIDKAYLEVFKRYQDGLQPAHIEV